MGSLKKDTCGVCGCIFFSNPPHKWKHLKSVKGRIQACGSCFDRYKDKGIDDPRKHYHERRLCAAIDRHESELEELQGELDALYQD